MIEITLDELDLFEVDLDSDGPQAIELDTQSMGDLELDAAPNQGVMALADPIQGGLIDLEFLGYPVRGMSAYEVAVKRGFYGNVDEWLLSLVGPESPNAAVAQAAEAGAIAARDLAEKYKNCASAYAIAAALSAERAEKAAQDAEGMAWTVEQKAVSVNEQATAVAIIKQEVEAWSTEAEEYAYSAMSSKNEANTSRADALVYKEQAASSYTSTEIAKSAATEQALLATQARTQSGSSADAAFFSETSAESYADEARMEAAAARTSAIRAKAYRDESELAAAATVIHKDRAAASATLAGEKATASTEAATSANISAGNASTYANQASSSAADADGAAFSAQISAGTAVAAKNSAQGSASTALTQASNAASSASDAAYYAGIALQAESNFGPVSAKAQLALDTAVSSDGKASSSFVFSSVVNGLASGFGSYNDGFGSVFGINANEFYVGIPGTVIRPFSISGGKIVLTGNVAIDGNLVVNGTINTAQIADRAVTDTESLSLPSVVTANGFLQTLISYQVTVSRLTKLICIANGSHGYTQSGAPGFAMQIRVNGGTICFNGGSGVRMTGVSLSGFAELGPGTHTVELIWNADAGSNLQMLAANMTVMRVYK